MLQQGRRVGEYILDVQIGAGAFGQVWRARHHVWNDQVVAIKVPTDPQYLRALQREGTVVHSLVHSNIVKALAFDPYADPGYLAMEYIPGTSLRPLITGGKLSIADSVAVMKQVLHGLAHAHAAGVVHRDVKPENVLIHERGATDGYGSEGVVKVTDFGLGQPASVARSSIVLSASLNDPGARDIAGTLDYMAPEQRAGDTVDARADLYACGVMLYEMLTGERPAGAELPSALNRDVPKYLDDAFRRAYTRRDNRFTSAQEFALALVEPRVPPPAPKGAWDAPLKLRRTNCPQCRGAINDGDQFCTSCGTQLVPVVRRCRACGAFPAPDDRFCIHCGATIDVGAAVTPASPSGR